MVPEDWPDLENALTLLHTSFDNTAKNSLVVDVPQFKTTVDVAPTDFDINDRYPYVL